MIILFISEITVIGMSPVFAGERQSQFTLFSQEKEVAGERQLALNNWLLEAVSENLLEMTEYLLDQKANIHTFRMLQGS